MENQLTWQQKDQQQNTKRTLQEPAFITTKELEPKRKILCVIPSLPSDFNFATLRSIFQQTVPVDMLVVLSKKCEGRSVGEKVSKVLNEGFSHIKLDDFDYILRVDGDVILPSNFLQENLKSEPDLCGGAGYAMLIKAKSFLDIMKGKFHRLSDDSYTCYKFMKEGCKFSKLRVEPIKTRQKGLHHGTSYFAKPKHQNILYFYGRGKAMHRLGYEPIHVFGRLRHSIWNIFAVIGYFTALIKREQKLDVADFVWHKQVRRLFSLDIGCRLW